MSAIHVLVASVPERRASCERLLADLELQTLVPARVELVLDGYGEIPQPACTGRVAVHRRVERRGPGARWEVAAALEPDAVVVVLDDDMFLPGVPRAVQSLAEAAQARGAGAAGGTAPPGYAVMWEAQYGGPLVCMNAGAMALRAGDLAGFADLHARVRAHGGFDPLGDGGDDEALVSAHLWTRGVQMVHVPIPGLRLTPGTQGPECQSTRRSFSGRPWDYQRRAIAQVTGWPWPT